MEASWDRIMKDLKKKRDEWEKLKEKLEGSLKKAPGGKIYMRRQKGKYPQYYFKDPASGAEEYIRKQETSRIQALFQKEYDQKCLSSVTENLNELDRFMKRMNPENFEDLYEFMPAGQKEWVQPVIVPDEIFARDWQRKMEEKKAGIPSAYPLTGEIVTENGEWVRSKSEKIIADKLRKKGIPYVYEVPLKLKGLGTVYPDFAVLDLLKRRTVWFEHFGRMDDPQYCQKALNKIQAYAMNGYWFGDGLLYTFETAETPLNTAFLDKIIGIGQFA